MTNVMRLTIGFLFCLSQLTVFSQTLCENGYAGAYPCENVDLLAHVSPAAFGGGTTNEVWGWTDLQDGKEYVLLGKSTGVGFFDISDPVNPIYLGHLPTHSTNSLWRTLRTYNDYLFVGSEATGHGLQVFDLHRLRNVVNPPVNFTEDAHYAGFGRCHTLVIEEETGYLYACGTNTFSGGLHIVNIQNPLAPVVAGGYDDDGYTHEAQVMVYNGPDPDYIGHTIVFCYNGNSPANLTIVDATNPLDATTVSITFYPNSAYCHQGWLTPDGKYLLMDDELDEYNNIFFETRTLVWNVEDLDNPVYEYDFLGSTEAIDHNQYIIGNLDFQSNYTAGFRLIDIRGIESQQMSEVGFFDHYPQDNDNVFEAEWMNYPFFASGVVPLTDIDNGMFLVKPNFIKPIQSVVEACELNTVEVPVYLNAGFEGPITFDVTGLPEGAIWSTDQIEYQSPDTAIILILLEEAEAMDYTIHVTATGAHFQYERSFVLRVEASVNWYTDQDGDGFSGEQFIVLCASDVTEVFPTGDCNDQDASVYPNAPGTFDEVDNNCNGIVEGDELPFCADLDGDGRITIYDLIIFNEYTGCEGMDCIADFNGDQVVNITDLFILLADFGEFCD